MKYDVEYYYSETSSVIVSNNKDIINLYNNLYNTLHILNTSNQKDCIEIIYSNSDNTYTINFNFTNNLYCYTDKGPLRTLVINSSNIFQQIIESVTNTFKILIYNNSSETFYIKSYVSDTKIDPTNEFVICLFYKNYIDCLGNDVIINSNSESILFKNIKKYIDNMAIDTNLDDEINISTYNDLYKIFQKVGVIGDSLSVGYMKNIVSDSATSRMLKYSWVKYVGRDANVPWLNLGTSGQSVVTWCSNETYGKVQLEDREIAY